MSFHLSAARRVECAILPRLLLGLVHNSDYAATDDAGRPVPDGEKATVDALAALLTEACFEPLDGLTEKERGKLARRVDRVAIDIFDAWRGDHAAKIGIAVMATVRDLHDGGALLMVTGSAMHRAFELMAPLLDDAFAQPRLAASGEKQSRHLLRDLQTRHGLFAAVDLKGQAA